MTCEENEINEFCVEVPGQYYQMMLVELSHCRGLEARLNKRSRRKV